MKTGEGVAQAKGVGQTRGGGKGVSHRCSMQFAGNASPYHAMRAPRGLSFMCGEKSNIS